MVVLAWLTLTFFVQAASGILFETEFDWLSLAPIAEERGYKDRVGEIMYSWYDCTFDAFLHFQLFRM